MTEVQKWILTASVIAAATCLAVQFLPWWIVVGIAAIAVWPAGLKPVSAFLAGFVSVALVFILMAVIINQTNGGILAHRVAGLFGGLPVWLLIMVSCLPAAIAAGLGAMTTALFLRHKKNSIKDHRYA